MIGAPSIGRHALVSQLLDGLRGLCEACQAHAVQDMWRLGELDVDVADDLDAIAPRVEEVQEAPRKDHDASCGQCRPDSLFVIDHQPEVSPVVAGLLAAFLKGKKLIAQIDESGMFALAPQCEFEQAAVEGQSLLDFADLSPESCGN